MKNRNGSYKKVLLSPEDLKAKLPFLQENVSSLVDSNLAPFEMCTLYILVFLRVRHERNWLQKKSHLNSKQQSRLVLDLIPKTFQLNSWEIEKLKDVTFEQLFLNFNLKGIPESINRTMLAWMSGEWDIRLLTHIPSPRELLKLQVQKARCLTITIQPEQLGELVLSARDPLSFVLHDLMHADHFFQHKEIIDGQLGFYEKINSIYEKDELKQAMKNNAQFRKEFEYVASDMNAYVIHLFKCLKSAIVKCDEKLFSNLLGWWQMPDYCMSASERLNTPAFTQEDETALREFFEKGKRV